MLTFLLVLAASLAEANPIPDLVAPEVTINIQPSSMDSYQLLTRRTPYTYSCQATVIQDRKVYVAAELVAIPGKTEKVNRHAGDYSLDFSVTIRGGRAESVVVVKRGEQVLTRQRSTVMLNTPSDARVVPLH